MIAFETDSHEPAFNLALEEYLFCCVAENRAQELLPHGAQNGIFILWQNGPSVIVGRHQNTPVEVRKTFLDRAGIPVVRRLTGGGAVYHDLGNINYTFIKPDSGARVDFLPFMRPVAEALQQCGIAAKFNSRNDLAVHGRKISGSAQLRRFGVVLHHGTLLYDVDMETMVRALSPDPAKMSLKGLDSVRSRVANLKELLAPEITIAVLKEAVRTACKAEKRPVPESVVAGAEALAKTRYRTWEWNWGTSPAFSVTRKERFDWGSLECGFRVERGIIAESSFKGDFFGNGGEELEAFLKGIPWRRDALEQALAAFDLNSAFHGCNAAVLGEFFCRLPDS